MVPSSPFWDTAWTIEPSSIPTVLLGLVGEKGNVLWLLVFTALAGFIQ